MPSSSEATPSYGNIVVTLWHPKKIAMPATADRIIPTAIYNILADMGSSVVFKES